MTAAFADTGFYVASLNPKDSLHPKASAGLDGYGHIYTTDYILIETAIFFTKPAGRPRFVRFMADLRTDRRTTVIPAAQSLLDRGLDLFAARPDQEWSLTDCISFIVMDDLGLTEALTADRHFTQAGFVPLLA